jgi:hypothetical protein
MLTSTRRRAIFAVATLVTGAVASSGAITSTAAAVPSVTPDFVAGNPSCTDLGYDYGYKPQPEPPPSGTYTFPGTSETVTLTSDGVYFDWSSTIGIDAVIAKGGPNANVYVYDPPAESGADTGLHSPINTNNDQPYGLSHIEFCYDYEVEVSKTADTSYTRTYDWTIDKSGDETELVLSKGQQFQVDYEVTVGLDGTPGYTDSDWAVDGTITVDNPWPVDATITGVGDVVSPALSATVDCGVTFPYTLPAGQQLSCDYGPVDLTDASSRTNTATVTTTGAVGGGTATVPVSFANATVTEVDDCIEVSDDKAGDLGTVCADEAPKTFTYSLNVGPYAECGDYQYTNIASFVTNDSETTGSDDWTVDVSVPCAGGCTLTQGYWKTHSLHGPAPHDDGWLLIGPSGADTSFFSSGKSYYEVLWTPPAGNVYYNLAHQYIAAELNILNGAESPPAVDAAMTQAAALLTAYTPAQAASLRGSARNAWLSAASTLDQYNNGLIGPGHCSE